MTITHTPGPWEINSKDIADIGGFKVYRYAISGSGAAIASVWAGDPQKQLKGVKHQGEANARLIASAPDLAAALHAMLDYYIAYGTFDTDDGAHFLKQGRDALAKARIT